MRSGRFWQRPNKCVQRNSMMWQVGSRHISVSIMVMYACALHLSWAIIALIDRTAIGATAVDALYRFINSIPVLIAVLIAAAAMAFFAMFASKPWLFLLLMPQQILLCMSAAGAIEAMWIHQFADGVIRPFGFIAADQMHIALAAAGHTAAIVAHALRIPR